MAYRQAITESKVPKGPRGEKRPADVIGAAVKVAKISVGDEPDDRQEAPVLSPAAQLGKLGGAARAKALTPEKRKEIARKGAVSVNVVAA
jgi:hypothetical protein